jgi:murein L,D-transpeptidase YafK
VVRRLGRGDTRYHRALLINYPNESDRVRFERARAAGTIPRGARIGGSIELHGSGGRQVDWTDGCVALTNRDMERVFAMVPIGSRVLIAGSLSTDLPYVHDSPDD